MSVIWVISGPNLDLLGTRTPEIYGTMTLDEHVARIRDVAARYDATVHHLQSNHEGELVDAIHEARQVADALIINAGALTHYSWSLHDALEVFEGVKIEVHLSNPAGRESFRRHSTLTDVVDGTIAGFGQLSYELAVYAVRDLLDARD